jgi:hypothetical protein
LVPTCLKTLILLKYIYLANTKFAPHYIYLLSFAKIDILLCNLVRNRQKRREESSFSIAKSIFEDKKNLGFSAAKGSRNFASSASQP